MHADESGAFHRRRAPRRDLLPLLCLAADWPKTVPGLRSVAARAPRRRTTTLLLGEVPHASGCTRFAQRGGSSEGPCGCTSSIIIKSSCLPILHATRQLAPPHLTQSRGISAGHLAPVVLVICGVSSSRRQHARASRPSAAAGTWAGSIPWWPVEGGGLCGVAPMAVSVRPGAAAAGHCVRSWPTRQAGTGGPVRAASGER